MIPAPRALSVVLAAFTIAAVGCGDDDDSGSGDATSVTTEDLVGSTFTSTDVDGDAIVDGTELRLSFEADSLAAIAGCNTMMGGWELDGETLVVGQLAQTRMACEDELQQQDERIADLLTGSPQLAFVDDALTLSSDTTTITFSAGE